MSSKAFAVKRKKKQPEDEEIRDLQQVVVPSSNRMELLDIMNAFLPRKKYLLPKKKKNPIHLN